jgi:hypothetical protein
MQHGVRFLPTGPERKTNLTQHLCMKKLSNHSNAKADQTVSRFHFEVSAILPALQARAARFDPCSSQNLARPLCHLVAGRDTQLLNLRIIQTILGMPLAIHRV